jgi:peptidyl-prolyl cis-trans isomerase B (cyclophilin B)
MALTGLHSCIRRSLIVNHKFIILLILALPLISCGRSKINKERTQNQIFAEILKREDRRWIGNDRFFEKNLIGDTSPEASRWSAIALGRIGNPEALPLLYSALRSGNAAVRAASAFAIAEIVERNKLQASQAVSELQRLLDDASLFVRMRAVEALGKIGSQPQAAEIVRRLEGISYKGDPYDRAYLAIAITALHRLKDPAARPVLERLADSNDPEIRWRALEALAPLQPSQSYVPLLMKNLRNQNPDVQARAAFLMAGADPSRASALFPLLPPYSKDTGKRNPLAVRIRALQALAFMKNPAAVPAIQAAISAEPYDAKHPDQRNFVIQAARALGSIPAATSDSVLLPLLRISGPIADEAAISLASLMQTRGTPERFVKLAESSYYEGRISDKGWVRAMAQIGGPEALEQLNPMLQRAIDTRNAPAREMLPDILRALAATGTPVSEETWASLIDQRDCTVLSEIAGLPTFVRPAKVPWAGAVEAFTACNASSNIQARLKILDALRLWNREKDVQQLLLAGLKDPDRRIRYACHEMLRSAGLPGLPIYPDPGNGAITDPMAQAISATRRNTTIAQIETTRGTMEIELFREDAPLTVHHFVLLAKRGAFNGMELSRGNPFQIEGRLPRTQNALSRTVNAEINMRPFERGSIGIALVEAADDSGPYGIFGNEYSDAGGFFISLSPQPELDGVHTCFGRVLSGLQIAEKIVPGDRIKNIHIKETIHIHDYRKYE